MDGAAPGQPAGQPAGQPTSEADIARVLQQLLQKPEVIAEFTSQVQATQRAEQLQAEQQLAEAQARMREADERAKAAEQRAAEKDARTRALEETVEELSKKKQCLETENAGLVMGADKTGTGFQAWILGKNGQGNRGTAAGGSSARGSAGGAPGSSSGGAGTGTAGTGTGTRGTASTDNAGGGTSTGTGARGDRTSTGAYGNLGDMLRAFLASHGAPSTAGAPANIAGAPTLTRPALASKTQEADRNRAEAVAKTAQLAAQNATLQGYQNTLTTAREQTGVLQDTLAHLMPACPPPGNAAPAPGAAGPSGAAACGSASMSVSMMVDPRTAAHSNAIANLHADRLSSVPILRKDFSADDANDFITALDRSMTPAPVTTVEGTRAMVGLDPQYTIQHFMAKNRLPREMQDEVTRCNMVHNADIEAFKNLVRAWSGVDVNTARSRARRALLNSQVCMQPGQSVRAFFTQFNQCLTKAEISDPAMRIDLFMRGLAPEIKFMCLVDSEGSEWTDLDALVKHAAGKQRALMAELAEQRAHAQSTPGPYRHAMGRSRPPLQQSAAPPQAQVQSLAWRDDARHGPSHGMNGRGSRSGAGPG
jgi:hypothetical protein